MSDSLRPHGLQHTRIPCPLLSPRVCPNSCALSWWCHPTIYSYKVVIHEEEFSSSFLNQLLIYVSSAYTYTCIDFYKEDYEELAYMIMRAEKSHYLPSANWRPKKASSVIQSKLQEGLRTREGKGVNISPRTKKMRWDMHSSGEAGKKKGGKSSVFCPASIQALNRSDDGNPHWGG